ncbi:MAG: glycosyltransferase family 2 protein [Gammaproteobacteria bacterium]|nr:glycosyltransferase family 2 protein [Gammaproteobacteria bacterium]
MSESFCLIVPHYDHVAQLQNYLPSLLAVELPILVVDDGSPTAARDRLRQLLADRPGTELIERPRNGGKGAATLTGMQTALAQGYSHAVCVDADGQHEAADVCRLCRAAAAHPDSIVSGLPLFGPDIPRARLYGRMITNVLVRLEAGSGTIRDAMCGLRCYPLALTVRVCESYRVRFRMDFDTEILVRAAWQGVAVCYVETRVRYPPDGVSHFRMFRDNVDMTLMHLRLLGGALLRMPVWLARRLRGAGRSGAS